MNEANILYIEDDVNLGRITYEVLTRNGYKVIWMQEGTKAYKLFSEGQFDLCIVDIMLPGMDGYSIVENIRRTNENVPIIFLSARSLPEDVIKGFTIGGNDYMRKPFSIEELIIRMQALLKRIEKADKKIEIPTISALGKYSFDRVSMTLALEDKVFRLTYMESELLHNLIMKINQVLYRQQILIELWGNDSFFNARSMDVFISKLRKHLIDDERIAIVNIRGKGFKLIYTE